MWAFVVSFCKSSKISGLDVYSTIDRIERLKNGLKFVNLVNLKLLPTLKRSQLRTLICAFNHFVCHCSYTVHPYGRGSSMKDFGANVRVDYPPHIPVVKSKEKDESVSF